MYGLRIGFSGLLAQRQGLETTGHNISNANTDGYSRQRTVIQGVGAPTTPALWSKWFGPGAGAQAIDIQRLRNQFLETRGQQENASFNFLKSQSTVLGRIELAFAEPGSNGVQAAMAAFFNAADDVANRPQDTSARIAFEQRAETVAAAFNQAKQQMADLRVATGDQITSRLAEVNNYADQIANLNDAIQKATIANLSPNDLQDQRDLLVSKLSALINVQTRYNADNTADVFIGGSTIVRGDRAAHLENIVAGDTYTLQYEGSNIDAEVTGGELGSLLHAYNVQLKATTPPGPYTTTSYQDQLRTALEDFVTQVNGVHTTGFDQTGVAGLALFQYNGTNDVIVNPIIVADTDRIAASGSATNLADGEVARAIAQLASSSSGPQVSYRAVIARLGVDSQRATQQSMVQEDIKNQIDSARSGEAGVNIDEEMVSMLSFQRAYDASAKFITTMDESLQTIINLIR